jgi:hypothetical protein
MKFLEGLAMENVGIFHGVLVYFTAIWYFIDICYTYFAVIWYIYFTVLVRCTKKNLATLAETQL